MALQSLTVFPLPIILYVQEQDPHTSNRSGTHASAHLYDSIEWLDMPKRPAWSRPKKEAPGPPLVRHICSIRLSGSRTPVPFFSSFWLFLVLADGFSSVLWRNAKTKTVSFLYTRSVLPPSKTFQKFHEPADQMQKTFCQKTVAEKCYNFVPSHRTKTLSVKKTLGKRRHTRDRLPVVYWLKKRAIKRQEGTLFPR